MNQTPDKEPTGRAPKLEGVRGNEHEMLMKYVGHVEATSIERVEEVEESKNGLGKSLLSGLPIQNNIENQDGKSITCTRYQSMHVGRRGSGKEAFTQPIPGTSLNLSTTEMTALLGPSSIRAGSHSTLEMHCQRTPEKDGRETSKKKTPSGTQSGQKKERSKHYPKRSAAKAKAVISGCADAIAQKQAEVDVAREKVQEDNGVIEKRKNKIKNNERPKELSSHEKYIQLKNFIEALEEENAPIDVIMTKHHFLEREKVVMKRRELPLSDRGAKFYAKYKYLQDFIQQYPDYADVGVALVDRMCYVTMKSGPTQKTFESLAQQGEVFCKLYNMPGSDKLYWYTRFMYDIANDERVHDLPQNCYQLHNRLLWTNLWRKTYKLKFGGEIDATPDMLDHFVERQDLLDFFYGASLRQDLRNESEYLGDRFTYFDTWKMETELKILGEPFKIKEPFVTNNEYIGDFCGGDRELKHPDFEDTLTPRCVGRQYLVGFTTAYDQIKIPRSCSCNEKIACITRQMCPPAYGDDPHAKAHSRAMWRDAYVKLMQELPLPNYTPSPDHLEQFLNHVPPQRRVPIYEAYKKQSWLGKDDSSINPMSKVFVKVETLLGKTVLTLDSRAISGKTDEFLAMVGPSYYAWQKQCSKLWSDGNWINQKYIYTGGMTGVEIGMIAAYFESLGWYAYEGDFSRYDGHTEEEALDCEYDCYEQKFSKEFADLLRRTISKRSLTMSKCSFTTIGKFDSGLSNTSFGNTLRGFMIAKAIEERLRFYGWDGKIVVMQLGDDNVYFASKRIDMDVMRKVSLEMGHILKVVERTPEEYDLLEYCSMRFWRTSAATRVLGPKPFRTLAKSFVMHKPLPKGQTIEDWTRVVATGFKHYLWVPVLGAVVDQFDVSASPQPVPEWQVSLREPIVHIDETEIAEQFAVIYGVDYQRLEQLVADVDFTKPGTCFTHPLFNTMLEIDGCELDEAAHLV